MEKASLARMLMIPCITHDAGKGCCATPLVPGAVKGILCLLTPKQRAQTATRFRLGT